MKFIGKFSNSSLSSAEQSSPWEANTDSASQEICHLLWKPNAHYLIHKIPPLVPILSQMNPPLASYFFKTCFNTEHSEKYKNFRWTLYL